MKKPLHIPESKRTQSLKVWCNRCKTDLTRHCGESKETPLEKCKYGADNHEFRAVVYLPNSKKRIVKFLGHDLSVAIRETILLREQVKNSGNKTNNIETAKDDSGNTEQATELNLLKAMSMHIAFLKNLRGHKHSRSKNEKTKGHISSIARTYALFGKAMKANGIQPESMGISISQEQVGFFADYLLSTMQYSGKTYDNNMVSMKSLFNYLSKKENIKIESNPFDTVTKRQTATKSFTIEPHEFNALLESISPENGIQTLSTNEKKNHYYPFIKKIFKIAMLCGLRREQLLRLSFENIVENDQGVPIVIVSNNLKVSRIKGLDEEDSIKTYTPITPQLRQLLIDEFAYNENKGSRKYIIEPDSHFKRQTLMNIASKSFGHYWNKLEFSKTKPLGFAELRKTFINRMTVAVGDQARHLTGHSDQKTLDKFYLDKLYLNKELIKRVATNSDIFPELNNLPKEEKRQHELEQIREQQEKQNDITREI